DEVNKQPPASGTGERNMTVKMYDRDGKQMDLLDAVPDGTRPPRSSGVSRLLLDILHRAMEGCSGGAQDELAKGHAELSARRARNVADDSDADLLRFVHSVLALAKAQLPDGTGQPRVDSRKVDPSSMFRQLTVLDLAAGELRALSGYPSTP